MITYVLILAFVGNVTVIPGYRSRDACLAAIVEVHTVLPRVSAACIQGPVIGGIFER